MLLLSLVGSLFTTLVANLLEKQVVLLFDYQLTYLLTILCPRNLTPIDAGLMRVVGKGGKERTIPVSGLLITKLKDWLYIRKKLLDGQQAPWLFVNHRCSPPHRVCIHRQLVRLAKKADIAEPISPHVLRHTFASRYAGGLGEERPGGIPRIHLRVLSSLHLLYDRKREFGRF